MALNPALLVIVATYNEIDNLPRLVPQITDLLRCRRRLGHCRGHTGQDHRPAQRQHGESVLSDGDDSARAFSTFLS